MKQGYATYSPAYVSMAYNLPIAQTYLTESWLKELNLDMVETVKKMMNHPTSQGHIGMVMTETF